MPDGSRVFGLQRRMMELGRVRIGDTGGAGGRRALSAFRFTSASRSLLEEIAERYGGEVRPWQNAPAEGYFEVYTEASELAVILLPRYADDVHGSPTTTYSQWFELWSKAGCQRRCDGRFEQLSGQPCLCEANGEEGKARACQVVTRVSFMLPGSRVGVWRLDTRSYYAAVEAPAMLDFLANAADGQYLDALLRIEHRTVKREVDGTPTTMKFTLPVFEFPGVKVPELERGAALSLNAPQPDPARPQLPQGPPPPPEPDAIATGDEPGFGTPPALPSPPPEPKALSKDAFEQKRAEAGVTAERAKEIGKTLFPGKAPSRLTQAEYGQWWAAIEKELATA